MSGTSAPWRLEEHLERPREDLDSEGTQEHQRDFVETLTSDGGTTDLERDAVDRPATHPIRAHRNAHAPAGLAREVEALRLDARFQETGGNGAEPYGSHRLGAAVSELSLERYFSSARSPRDADLGAPLHLEAKTPQTSHRGVRNRPADCDGEHDRAAKRHDDAGSGSNPHGHHGRSRYCHVECRSRRVKIHRLFDGS
jgi:hypothetical protein